MRRLSLDFSVSLRSRVKNPKQTTECRYPTKLSIFPGGSRRNASDPLTHVAPQRPTLSAPKTSTLGTDNFGAVQDLPSTFFCLDSISARRAVDDLIVHSLRQLKIKRCPRREKRGAVSKLELTLIKTKWFIHRPKFSNACKCYPPTARKWLENHLFKPECSPL